MNATLPFWARNFGSKKCFIKSVKISTSIQLLGCAFYGDGKNLCFWSISDFCSFQWQVTVIFYLSVSLTFSPLRFSRFNSWVLFGSAWKKKSNSWALKISSMAVRWVFFQGPVISGVYDFFSHDTVLNLTLFRAFHLSADSLDALKLPMSSLFLRNHSLSPERLIHSLACYLILQT